MTATIQVGTRISGGPYNYGIGIVTKYELGSDGCFMIGRGVTPVSGYVDIVWPTHESKHLPANIVAGLPYRIHTDRLGTAEEVAHLRAQIACHQASEKAKADEAAIARAALRVQLLTEYPHLSREENALICAGKNIRTMLKAAFPETKFSVKSSRYSGGSSIDIRWTDGPASEAVEDITGRFQHGHFDGMTDCYNYSGSVWCDLFGGAQYVHTQRSHSTAALLAAVELVMRRDYPNSDRSFDDIATAYENGRLYGDDEWLRRDINQALDHQEAQ